MGHVADWCFLPRAHRSRRGQAQGHQLPARRHEDAGHHACGRSGRSPARPSSTRRSSTTCACRVENLVGKENEGWGVAITTLAHERDVLTHIRHISLRNALHRLIKMAKGEQSGSRRPGSGAAPEDGAALHQRAGAADERLPRPHEDHAGGHPGPEGSTAKLLWSQRTTSWRRPRPRSSGRTRSSSAERLGARRRAVGVLRAARARQRHPRGDDGDPEEHPRRARARPAERLTSPTLPRHTTRTDEESMAAQTASSSTK